jgi:hypothetical protein
VAEEVGSGFEGELERSRADQGQCFDWRSDVSFEDVIVLVDT